MSEGASTVLHKGNTRCLKELLLYYIGEYKMSEGASTVLHKGSTTFLKELPLYYCWEGKMLKGRTFHCITEGKIRCLKELHYIKGRQDV